MLQLEHPCSAGVLYTNANKENKNITEIITRFINAILCFKLDSFDSLYIKSCQPDMNTKKAKIKIKTSPSAQGQQASHLTHKINL